jgi:hypothetical protein
MQNKIDSASTASSVIRGKWATFQIESVNSRTRWDVKARALIQNSNYLPQITTHWLAYPNLKDASVKLLSTIGEWTPHGGGKPQVLKAIEAGTEAALHAVREGNAQAKVVTGCYLFRMAEVAAEIANFNTFGIGAHPFKENIGWAVGSEDIYEWSRKNGFTAARTEERDNLGEDERRGVVIKLLSSCASARDVGMALRYEHFL